MVGMSEVTQILSRLEEGDPTASEELLPLVYDELRKLAAARMASENPGQTLQATALVHEAYLSMVDVNCVLKWDSRGHFFAAAAEAMRRILIQQHRRKTAEKRGGNLNRVALSNVESASSEPTFDVVALSEAIDLLADHDQTAADLAKLRIYAGLSVDESGAALRLPRTSAYRLWAYAQAWLRAKLSDAE